MHSTLFSFSGYISGWGSAEVYRQPFWLGLLGAKTPKRLTVWSNDPLISALDLGKLCAEKRKELDGEKTTRPSAI